MVCDCEYPAFLSVKTRRAKKEHKCCECLGTIPFCAQYEVATGKWDGEFVEFKTCLQCVALRKEVFEKSCYVLGGISEEISQFDEENYTKPIKLFIERRKLNGNR